MAKPKKRRPARRQTLIITVGPDGARPRRRADIRWPVGRRFTMRDLTAQLDCRNWVLEPGFILRIRVDNGEDE